MKVQDLGSFDDPVVLFGGAYSNLHALRALRERAKGRPVLSTGDLVAYGGNPAETITSFRDLGWPSIAGNCEKQIALGEEDCGCGFDEGSTCDVLSKGWYPFALSQVSASDRAWMADLPDILTFAQHQRRYAVFHGGVTDIARFLWPSSDARDFQHEIAALEDMVGPVDGVVAGHSGIPFHRRIGDRQWINAGAIGLPPHDARTETRFAVLDQGDVIIERLCYDSEAASAAMEAAGLTQGYHTALRTGVWPSEDVLPAELRR